MNKFSKYESNYYRISLKLNRKKDADILKMLKFHELLYPGASLNRLVLDALRHYLRYGYGYNPD